MQISLGGSHVVGPGMYQSNTSIQQASLQGANQPAANNSRNNQGVQGQASKEFQLSQHFAAIQRQQALQEESQASGYSGKSAAMQTTNAQQLHASNQKNVTKSNPAASSKNTNKNQGSSLGKGKSTGEISSGKTATSINGKNGATYAKQNPKGQLNQDNSGYFGNGNEQAAAAAQYNNYMMQMNEYSSQSYWASSGKGAAKGGNGHYNQSNTPAGVQYGASKGPYATPAASCSQGYSDGGKSGWKGGSHTNNAYAHYNEDWSDWNATGWAPVSHYAGEGQGLYSNSGAAWNGQGMTGGQQWAQQSPQPTSEEKAKKEAALDDAFADLGRLRKTAGDADS
jgi:hypothetical protein